jgi:hypothetical protein
MHLAAIIGRESSVLRARRGAGKCMIAAKCMISAEGGVKSR